VQNDTYLNIEKMGESTEALPTRECSNCAEIFTEGYQDDVYYFCSDSCALKQGYSNDEIISLLYYGTFD